MTVSVLNIQVGINLPYEFKRLAFSYLWPYDGQLSVDHFWLPFVNENHDDVFVQDYLVGTFVSLHHTVLKSRSLPIEFCVNQDVISVVCPSTYSRQRDYYSRPNGL